MTAPPKLPDDSQQWFQLWKEPLTWLVREHPSLTTVIGDHRSSNPKFLLMPSVDLVKIFRVKSVPRPTDVSRIIQEELRQGFDHLDHKTPLWRAVVVPVEEDRSFFILITIHHVIVDGRSLVALMEQLVQQLNLYQSQIDWTERTLLPRVVNASTHPFPAPIEGLVKCSPTWSALLKDVVSDLVLPAAVKKSFENQYWAGDCDSNLMVPRETEVHVMSLTQEETSAMFRAAKVHKTTVQGMLFAASIFATKAVFLSKVDKDTKIKTTTKDGILLGATVSARSLFVPPVGPFHQGNYSCEFFTHTYVQLNTNFWTMARNYREETIQKTQTKEGQHALLGHVGILQYLPKYPGLWEKALRDVSKRDQHGRKTTLRLANLGSAFQRSSNKEDNVAFKVLRVFGAQDADPTNDLFNIAVATANGCLSTTTTWQKSAVKSGDQVRQVMTEMRRILAVASEPGRETYLFQDTLEDNESERSCLKDHGYLRSKL